jgi:probable phosphoglycerate mutase
MTTRLLLIRHGATNASAEDRFSGATNAQLSEVGRQQARLLALRLADDPITAVYASSLQRAIDTAAIVGEPHGLQPVLLDGVREIDHGHWEELTRAEVESRFPEEYRAWESDPLIAAPAGGESGLQVLARALPAIRSLVLKHAGETVVVVSHKATIRLIISSLLGFDARGYRDRLDQSPACLNVLDFKDSVHARLMLFNDVSHYRDQPASPQAHLSKWWDAVDRQEGAPLAGKSE